MDSSVAFLFLLDFSEVFESSEEKDVGSPSWSLMAVMSLSVITLSFDTPRSAKISVMRISMSSMASISSPKLFLMATRYFSSSFFAVTSISYDVRARWMRVISFICCPFLIYLLLCLRV